MGNKKNDKWWLKQKSIPFDTSEKPALQKAIQQSGAGSNGSTAKNQKTVKALDGLNRIIGQHAANRAKSMRGLAPSATDVTQGEATSLDTSGIVRGDEYSAYLKNKKKYGLT